MKTISTLFLKNLIAIALTTGASAAWSATTFLFNVDSTTYTPDTTGAWQSSGSAQFQLSVRVDENQYSAQSVPPPGYETIVDAYQDVSMPILSTSGESIDAVSAFRAGADLDANTFYPDPIANYSMAISSSLGGYFQQLGFFSNVSDDHFIGDVYVKEGSQVQQYYSYSETFRLALYTQNTIDPQPLSPADFFARADDLVGVDGAFTFSNSALEQIDECLPGSTTICASSLGLDLLQVNGIRYSGTATLVSVTSVPLPAAGWLFATASAALIGIGRRKALQS